MNRPNIPAIKQYLKDGGNQENVQFDRGEGQPLFTNSPHLEFVMTYLKQGMEELNTEISSRVENFSMECMILYLYGVHDDIIKDFYTSFALRFPDYDKTIAQRISLALTFWEHKYQECNSRVRFLMAIFMLEFNSRQNWQHASSTLEQDFKGWITPTVGTFQPDDSDDVLPSMPLYFEILLVVPEHLTKCVATILDFFISWKFLLPKHLHDERHGRCFMDRFQLYATISGSTNMIDFFCSRFPEDCKEFHLTEFEMEEFKKKVETDYRFIRGIFALPTKHEDFMSKLASSCLEVTQNNSKIIYTYDDQFYVPDPESFEHLLMKLRTDHFFQLKSVPRDFLGRNQYNVRRHNTFYPLRIKGIPSNQSPLYDLRREIIPSFWYYTYHPKRTDTNTDISIVFDISIVAKETHIITDLMKQGANEFESRIVETFNILYANTTIILPFIQQIVENIFLTPYAHNHVVEKKCLTELVKSLFPHSRKRKYVT